MPACSIPQACTQESTTSSAGKASASLCLAAYSGEHLPLVHRASGSGTVPLRQSSKSEGKREHVTEGLEQKGGKKAHATVTERTRLRLSQETQTSIDRHHKGQQEAEPMRGVSAGPWAGRMCRFDSWNGLLSCHLPMHSCWCA